VHATFGRVPTACMPCGIDRDERAPINNPNLRRSAATVVAGPAVSVELHGTAVPATPKRRAIRLRREALTAHGAATPEGSTIRHPRVPTERAMRGRRFMTIGVPDECMWRTKHTTEYPLLSPRRVGRGSESCKNSRLLAAAPTMRQRYKGDATSRRLRSRRGWKNERRLTRDSADDPVVTSGMGLLGITGENGALGRPRSRCM
jgi:hypothetical protein